MDVFLIRHGQTQGNIARRYIGRTDEPLSQAGLAAFCNLAYPAADTVYCSPLRRCRQTAEILYPAECPRVEDDLQEYDFGAFEGKTYAELADRDDYRAWIAGEGMCETPGGEAIDAFKERCCRTFAAAVDDSFAAGTKRVAVVTHGGVIMAILERFALPAQPFYTWQADNLGGWAVAADPADWAARRTVTVTHKIGAGGMLECFTPFR